MEFTTTTSSMKNTTQEFDPKQWLSLREPAHVTHESERPYGEKFYVTPFLTCKECNCCSFVNDGPLRMRILQLQTSSMNYLNQDMPPCPRCGSSHAYVLGTHDFGSQIRDSRDALAGDRRERARAAAVIQNIMRSYHIRMKYKRYKKQEREMNNRRANAVTQIQALYRGHHGRFRFAVFKSLRRIRDTHVIVLERALREDFGDHTKVFWYKRKTERRILFQDFEVYVRRTGGRPPKHKVASNIHTIRKRVHILECEYATRIQSRWRGVLGRKWSRKYRQIQARRLERLTTAALKIQRCAMAWYGRATARHARDHRRAKISTEQYLRERKERKKNQIDRNWKRRTLLMYQKERAEEMMARLTGKTAYGELNGHKITAFQQSVYYDDRVGKEMVQYGRNKQTEKQEKGLQVRTRHDRDQYLLQKYETNDSFKHYYKSELSPQRASSVRYKLNMDHTRSKLIRNSLSHGVLSRGAAKILENYYLKKKRKSGLL